MTQQSATPWFHSYSLAAVSALVTLILTIVAPNLIKILPANIVTGILCWLFIFLAISIAVAILSKAQNKKGFILIGIICCCLIFMYTRLSAVLNAPPEVFDFRPLTNQDNGYCNPAKLEVLWKDISGDALEICALSENFDKIIDPTCSGKSRFPITREEAQNFQGKTTIDIWCQYSICTPTVWVRDWSRNVSPFQSTEIRCPKNPVAETAP